MDLGELVEHWTLVGSEIDLAAAKHRDTPVDPESGASWVRADAVNDDETTHYAGVIRRLDCVDVDLPRGPLLDEQMIEASGPHEHARAAHATRWVRAGGSAYRCRVS
jgi:hypothetical protein